MRGMEGQCLYEGHGGAMYVWRGSVRMGLYGRGNVCMEGTADTDGQCPHGGAVSHT